MSTRIGYACLALGVPGSEFHTCTAKNAAPERLRGIVAQNLGALRRLIAYNAENGIRLFRITSDLIPFAGTPLNPLRWEQEFSCAFAQIGAEAARAGIRLSLHPGQYTVLNSPDPRVVENAAAELAYHDKILGLLGVGPSGKLVLHVGGVYGDKAAALRRFCENWDGLCDSIRRRVVLENDERCYDIADVLALAEHLGIPAVFDVLHHAVHPPAQERPLAYWLKRCARTWKTADGPQKLHYSQQSPGGRPGAHSATIDVARFLPFYGQARALGADIMLEVKDKNLSALKCIHATAGPRRIELLREDWARMEYAVLEHAPEAAAQARTLLERACAFPAAEFYALADRAMEAPVEPENAARAARLVFGLLEGAARPEERRRFSALLERYRAGTAGLRAVKGALFRLAQRCGRDDLLASVYFIEAGAPAHGKRDVAK